MPIDDVFIQEALAAGFDEDQAEFLLERLAQRPHTHTSDEVITDEESGETLADVVEDLDC